MTTAFQKILEAISGGDKLLTLGGNRPFSIKDPLKVWLVERGAVDLFVRRGKNGPSRGGRRHLLRVAPGEMLCGLDTETLRLEASPIQGSALREIALTLFRDLASGELEHPIRGLLERWILALSRGLLPGNRDSLPDIEHGLPAGSRLEVERGLRVHYPSRRGVVWVGHEAGSSTLLGHRRLPPINGRGLFPLAYETWLEAREKATLRGWTTAEWMEKDPEWGGLTAFHEQAVRCLSLTLDSFARADAERLETRGRAEKALYQEALTLLAARQNEMAPSGGGADALITACKRVGKVLGISIRTPWRPAGPGESRNTLLDGIARANHIRIRRVTLDDGWWKRDGGPLLGFLEEEGSPVALLPRSSRRYEMVDPGKGTRETVAEKRAEALHKDAYTFYTPLPAGRITPATLFGYALFGRGRDVLSLFLMGLLGGLLGLAAPFVTGLLINRVIPGAEIGQLLQICLALFTAALAGGVFQLTRGIAAQRLQGRWDERVQAGLWDRLLKLPVTFFRKFPAGELAERIMAVDRANKGISGQVLHAVLTAAFSLLSLGLLFVYSPMLALHALAIVLLAVAVTGGLGALHLQRQRRLLKLRNELGGKVLQFVTAIAKLRVAGAEKRAFLSWARSFAVIREISVKAREITSVLETVMSGLPILASMVFFAVLATSEIRENLSIGAFLAFNAAFGQFLAAGMSLTSVITPLLMILPAYEQLHPILDERPETDDGLGDPGQLKGDIEVSHISFRYDPEGPPVLEDVDFRIRRGEFVAIVGPSGSGKSTLLRLLLGFERPLTGALYYDNMDLSSLDITAVRRQTGVVLQDSRLMAGDIFSNIAGARTLTLNEAWEAARLAGIEEDILGMPMQMHTVVPQGGGSFSGGQIQRILIARALASHPRIIFMDEATSALDTVAQKVIQESMEALAVTRLVIAHRLSTVQNADRIVVLEGSRVRETGTYEALMEKNGSFAALARRQIS